MNSIFVFFNLRIGFTDSIDIGYINIGTIVVNDSLGVESIISNVLCQRIGLLGVL
jgi:hypothetical protein